MKLYKKVFLTLSGAGILAGCTHKELVTLQGRIIDMRVNRNVTACILDIDGDGLADRQMSVMDKHFCDYVSIGDTIRYKTKKKNNINLSVAPRWANSYIVDINGHTLEDVQQRHQINLLRKRWGQEKQR